LTREELFPYIRKPFATIGKEAKNYIKRYKGKILLAFLYGDADREEFEKIAKNPYHPLYIAKKIRLAVEKSLAETVAVTVRISGIEATFDLDAKCLMLKSLVPHKITYEDPSISENMKKSFKTIVFGEYYIMPREVVRIVHEGKTIYEAPDANK
jgi:hypothetical protein